MVVKATEPVIKHHIQVITYEPAQREQDLAIDIKLYFELTPITYKRVRRETNHRDIKFYEQT